MEDFIGYKINKMDDKHCCFSLYCKSPLSRLFISLLIVLVVGMGLFSGIFLAGTLFFHVDLKTLSNNFFYEPGSENIEFLRYLMIFQGLSFFIVPAIIILYLMKPVSLKNPMAVNPPKIIELFMVIMLALCIIPITSFTGQINSGMHLPNWLSGVEQWMIENEDRADNLIDLLIDSDTFGIMMLNLFMVALIPAIGEEMIFRGVFQNIFNELFKSGHFAVWFTAFIFSTLHFQFFGFIPRFILGLVYGYLFFWSNTLWFPVIAHFVNNAVPVIVANIQNWMNINSQPSVPLWKQAVGLPLPIVASVLILLYFRNRNRKNSETEVNQSQLTNT
jgi:uncharacterized protein